MCHLSQYLAQQQDSHFALKSSSPSWILYLHAPCSHQLVNMREKAKAVRVWKSLRDSFG